jgi:DNA-binding transcriptional regulator YhcF (GntR family)
VEEVKKEKSPLHGKDPRKLADEKAYADITVSKAFRKLNDEGILIKMSRGMHMVNPEYFYRGVEKDRKVLLQKALSIKAGLSPKDFSNLNFM